MSAEDGVIAAPPVEGNAEWPAVWASIACALVTYILLAEALEHVIPAAAPAVNDFLPYLAGNVRPEPLERARYLLALACIPILPTLYYALFAGSRHPDRRPLLTRAPDGSAGASILARRDAAFLVCITLWLAWLATGSQIPNIGAYLLGAAALGCMLFLRHGHWPAVPRIACLSTLVLIALLTFRNQIVTEKWFFLEFNMWHHIDILLGVVNQVMHGKTILVDTTSQYGTLFPYVVAVATALPGLDVLTMSTFFAALLLAQLWLVHAAVGRLPGMTLPWRTVFLACYAGLVIPMLNSAMFNLPHELLLPDNPYRFVTVPVYFQFAPIRTFWPALFMWFVPLALAQPTRWRISAGYALAGAAFLWNPDTGLVVLLAWSATLVYARLGTWRKDPGALFAHALRQLAFLIVTLAAMLAAYAVFAWLRAGRFPDYASLFWFQGVFYGSGYFMLPMPLRELWQPVIALYALTIAWCMRLAWNGTVSGNASWKFFIATFGLGAFSYYQGRSMVTFLPSNFAPVIVLAFIWTYEGAQRLRSATRASILADAGLRYCAIITAGAAMWCLVALINFGRSLPSGLVYAVDTDGPLRFPERYEQIWSAVRPHVQGRDVLILSSPSAYIHIKTGSASMLPNASPTEVFLMSQVAEIDRALDRPDTLVLLHKRTAPPWVKYLRLDRLELQQEFDDGFVLFAQRSPPR